MKTTYRDVRKMRIGYDGGQWKLYLSPEDGRLLTVETPVPKEQFIGKLVHRVLPDFLLYQDERVRHYPKLEVPLENDSEVKEHIFVIKLTNRDAGIEFDYSVPNQMRPCLSASYVQALDAHRLRERLTNRGKRKITVFPAFDHFPKETGL